MDMLPPMLLMRVPKKEESKGSVHELPCSRPRENGSSTNLRERFRDRPHHFPGNCYPLERLFVAWGSFEAVTAWGDSFCKTCGESIVGSPGGGRAARSHLPEGAGSNSRCLPSGSSHNGFRPPGGGGGGCLPVGIRMGSLSGLGPACGAGVDEDGLGPSSPGIAGSSGMFEVPYGDLPECFHISPEAQAHYPVEIQRAIQNVKFIHHHQMQQDKFDEQHTRSCPLDLAASVAKGTQRLT
ncbi:hypothetical protein E2C01_004321 [Portunus trituberculatus]|uniref:Uncharacterized protein n=1 Tax=Portunus trituberculatus TaxID=210409 RepID=A0A5B7CQ94_PORTR|nr:hypothetical protein [Portunus trituberculatus]